MLASFSSHKRLSCGIVVLNPARELLLCHVTGQNHWDLPKGGMDAGETPLATALRETREETGLAFDAEPLLDLGAQRYTAKKDLHLFAVLAPRFELTGLHCESLFCDRPSGHRLPEMDDYAWVGFDHVGRHCTAKMAEVLQRRLDLDRLLDTLSAQPGSALAAQASVVDTGRAAPPVRRVA